MKKYSVALMALLMSSAALAEETTAVATAAAGTNTGMIAMASAIAICVAVLGGTLAQGKAAAAALEGVSRNPAATDKLFTPFILSLALIESLVILAFLVSFVKIGGLL